MPTITEDMTINEVVNKYPATMKVFNDHKVDSCCGGAESIKTTANVANADIPKLMEDLNNAVNKKG
ncbi:MAG: DUF542 domain-containing protein [Nitrospinota bacterium]|nr:DUF542 domain-containing protein [Nitrospinota bacterium]